MAVSVVLLIISAVVFCTQEASARHEFKIVNKCSFTIFPGALSTHHSIPKNGGWRLRSGDFSTIHLENNWSGRFWARTGCQFDNNGRGSCATGDCGRKLECNGAGGIPPATLAEFTLDGHGNQDFYDVSLVDGYNLPIRITPIGQHNAPRGRHYCRSAGCTSDLNRDCPNELKKIVNGGTVACYSACEKFRTDHYCCRGAHNRPQTCRPRDWPTNYAAIFKSACPQAYSYAYDDQSSTFTCGGLSTGYTITFCP